MQQKEPELIEFKDFLKVDIRAGTILKAEVFPEAKKPALKLEIDFGSEIGIKKTSAQITALYSCESLIGKQILAVVNFPKKQIGKFMSEVLTLGLENDQGQIVLLQPEMKVPNGSKVH